MGKIYATSISTSGPRKGSLKTAGICKPDDYMGNEAAPNTAKQAKPKDVKTSVTNNSKQPSTKQSKKEIIR